MERLKEKVSLLESQAVMKELTIRNQQRKISKQERDFDQIIQQNDDLLQRITKHQKIGIPYCYQTFECLSVRLKMPQFTCITLQPLIEAHPEIENIIAEKAREGFYQDMIGLQNELMTYHVGGYRGVSITQEYFWYQGQPVGLLKAQINKTHCTLPRALVIRLFDYGMIDWIIFNQPEEIEWFGEKINIVIGNITVSESVQA